MSMECEAYIGYTVTLKEDLEGEDFDFFNEFIETHDEYNQYECEGTVLVVVDGVSGCYARLIFVDKHIEECWISGRDYFPLKTVPVPPYVYDELNKAYRAMYDKDIVYSSIEYALSFVFS